MQKKSSHKRIPLEKPDLPPVLFWEYQYDSIDWKKAFRLVIERTLDWGKDSEVEELIRFYGRDTDRMVFMEYPIYLMEHSLERACRMFGIEKEETVCYRRKMERGNGWV